MLELIKNFFNAKPGYRDSFSYSQLNTFNNCPYQYKLIYNDGIRKDKESIEAYMGKRVHDVMEWLYNSKNKKQNWITFDKICEEYNRLWIKKWHKHIYIFRKNYDSNHYYSLGKECLSNYYQKYGPTFDQIVEGVELELSFKVDEYKFKGIIDRLDHPAPRKWIIHDYKTGVLKTQKQAENDMQLALYQMAVEQNFGDALDIELKWHFMKNGSEVTLSHSKKHLDKVKDKIIKNVEKIRCCNDESKLEDIKVGDLVLLNENIKSTAFVSFKSRNQKSIGIKKNNLLTVQKKAKNKIIVENNEKQAWAVSNSQVSNKFIPKETKFCNWCYYWNECPVKFSRNPSGNAKLIKSKA